MSKEKGQSLVEMALVTPILIFFLLGVFEAGWALRTYLILSNANREAARYAVRTGSLSFEQEEPGYRKVYTHTLNSLVGQVDFERNGIMIISTVMVGSDFMPCDPEKREPPITYTVDGVEVVDNWPNCDCSLAVTNPFTQALFLTPLEVPTYTYTIPETATITSLIDYTTVVSYMLKPNNELNCQHYKRGMTTIAHRAIYVEFFYQHPQLMGFPMLSNVFTDPIPMYLHTVFRQIQESRTRP